MKMVNKIDTIQPSNKFREDLITKKEGGLRHKNTILWDRSQKNEISPDSIINYFIFTKI